MPIFFCMMYMHEAKNDQVHKLAVYFGLDENLLRNMMNQNITKKNINEFGRFETLKATVNLERAKIYFELAEGKRLSDGRVKMEVDKLLSAFICSGGFELPDIDMAEESKSKPYPKYEEELLNVAEPKAEYKAKKE